MSIRLKGQNFQSWESFDITVDGLTVVTGPSNLGKSALFRSLKGLLRNELNEAQVRLSSDGMEIEAAIDGHTVVARRKKKGSVSYAVDGAEYAKLGGAIPEPIQKLAFSDITIGDTRLDPIFASQFGGQFMLEESPTSLNSILGAFSSTERLESGKREANGRVAVLNAEAKIKGKEAREMEDRKAKLEVLSARAIQIQQVIDEVEPEVRRREKQLALLDELIAHKRRLAAIQAKIAEIHIPDTESIAQQIQKAAALQRVIVCRTRYDSISRTLSRLVVPDVEQPIAQYKLALALHRAITVQARYNRIRSTLDRLVVPDIAPAIALYKKMRTLGEAADARRKLAKATAGFTAVGDVVATWTHITETFRKGKALSAAIQARLAQQKLQSNGILADIEQTIEHIESLCEEASQWGETLGTLDFLIQHRESQGSSAAALAQLDQEYEAAVQAVRAIEEENQQAALRAASKCPTCGNPMKKPARLQDGKEKAA